MKNIKYIKSIFCLALLSIAFTSCEEDLDSDLSNFVGFDIGVPQVVTVPNNSTSTYDVKVYSSEVSSSDRSFGIMVDESSTLAATYSVPSQVTIPANSNEGVMSISITDNDDLSFIPQDLIINFVGESGVNFGEGFTISITEECLNTIVTLDLDFDAYAEEAYWEIYDLSGTPTIIYSGGESAAYTALDNSTFSMDFCLASGNYGIVVYDTYGDGGTTYTVSIDGAAVASGSTPDAGGGYPVLTNSSATFTVN